MSDRELAIFTSIAAFGGWALLSVFWWIEWSYRKKYPMLSAWSFKEKLWLVTFHIFVIAVTAFAIIG